MKIWLVTIGEPLPIDGGGASRLLRAGILSAVLAREGHEVTWWTSTFDHVGRKHRFFEDTTVHLEDGVVVKLLHGCGYERNVSFKRIADHRMLARKFAAQSKDMAPPDVVLCSLPPLELPCAVTRYGKARGVPVIVDVRDLWPDVLLELAPRWSRRLFNIALAPMWIQARAACRDAYAITGNSPDFVKWGLERAGRPAGPLDRHFPFGYAVPQLTEEMRRAANRFWDALPGLAQGGFKLCFFGTIGKQFDLETVVDAALMLEAEGADVQFILCGAGEGLESLKLRAKGCQAVVFPGWIGRAEIWTLMALCDAGLAPYRNHPGFTGNFPNKPIEYFAGGLPVVSGLRGYLEELLARTQTGVTYAPGNPAALCDVIRNLAANMGETAKMSANARTIFADEFDSERVYGAMSHYLGEVAESYREDVSRSA